MIDARRLVVLVLALTACKKPESPSEPAKPTVTMHAVGLVTDVGGRGDQSFNDSALRGLENWGTDARFENGRYHALSAEDYARSLPGALKGKIHPLPISAIVVQSKAQEDYEPNLQLLVDQGAALTVGVGFMLENAVEAVAKKNPKAKFLLIDSPILDAKGVPQKLPNVRTVTFREEEGSFLVGALSALVSKGQIGFVGGMEIPLIKKFEAGYRAGVKTVSPEAAAKLVASYTGSFDNVQAGKQIAADMLAKGVDVIFHAAGSDGLGVIQAVKEAREAGKNVYVIGVDSDQHHLAPNAVLTSMVKRVDLAVYEAAKSLVDGTLSGGDVALGLAEEAVGFAEVRLEIPNKAESLAKVEELRKQIVEKKISVPSTLTALEAFKAQP